MVNTGKLGKSIDITTHQPKFWKWIRRIGCGHRHFFYPGFWPAGQSIAHVFTPPGLVNSQILFVHSTGNDALYPQLHLFKSWIAAGNRVFSFDLDGHGIFSTSKLSAGTIPTNLTRLYDTLKHEVPDIASLPLHGVGYSLGGALLVKPSPIPFASLTLIATPTSVRLSLLQILSEIIGFVYPHVLKLATDYGFWSLLPALLNFKRTEYPIRLVQNGDYIAEITKIFDDLALNDTAEMRECPIHLIYGTHDLIATQKDCQTLAKSINNATVTIRKRRSHLSIMLDREMGNLIADWTSKSEIQPDFPGAKN